jgi:nitroimidazol reductase NimA-like FMN-containing flavoprotein (pyridoxamine 5'-phosphate oxidase superfamily)
MEELSRAEIDEMLANELVGRIGCHVDGLTYVVPVIYAYHDESLYVFSVEGQKTRMMRQNPSVCFEVDRYDRPGEWQSVIVQGWFEELSGSKVAWALALLASRFARLRAGASERRRREPGRDTVAFRIRIGEVTGRRVSRQRAASTA